MSEKAPTLHPDEWPYPGARWWKFDLHTHTPASVDYGKGPDQAKFRKIKPRDWLLDFMQAGIDCVAVTDHNSSEWIEPLKEALATLDKERPSGYRPLTLFPGVELTASGGVHILAIFDPAITASKIQSIIGAVNYGGNPGESSQACKNSPIEIIEAVTRAGGIAIPAHADMDAGLWKQSGNTINPIIELESFIAVEQSGATLPSHLPSNPHALAIVLGSDSHHPLGSSTTKQPGSHFTWIKAGAPNLVGLEMALLANDESTIRRSDATTIFDPFKRPDHFLESISVHRSRRLGQPDPVTIKFSPRLNTIIGGRGTGKSSFVHALRFAFDRGDELSKSTDFTVPYQTYDRFIKQYDSDRDEGVFTKNTTVVATGQRNGIRYRVTADAIGNRRIEEQDAETLNWNNAVEQHLTSVRFSMRLLSQGQLASLSSDDQRPLLELIDQAAFVADAKAELGRLGREYIQLQLGIQQFDLEFNKAPETRQALMDVVQQLSRYDQSQFIAQAIEAQKVADQDQYVAGRIQDVAGFADSIEQLAQRLSLPELDTASLDRSESSNTIVQQSMTSLEAAVSSARKQMGSISDILHKAASTAKSDIHNSEWAAVGSEKIQRHQQTITESRGDGEFSIAEYDRLQQRKQEIEHDLNSLDETRVQRENFIEKAQEKMAEMIVARRAVTQRRINFLENELADNRYVRISVIPYGSDQRVVSDALRTVMKITDGTFPEVFHGANATGQQETGLVADLMSQLPEEPEQRQAAVEERLQHLHSRVQAACEGKRQFGARFDARLQRQAKDDPLYQSHIATWFPDDALEVQFNAGKENMEWRSIRQASAGQRSAAMLAFLLSYGQEPLVIDQPEDDLDNRLVYDLVAKQIRDRKSSRQVIVVTHNANVVVHGDSDMMHAMEYRKGQCKILAEGSMCDDAVRDAVCDVMEGGKAAFARRYRRLFAGETR